MAQIIRAITVDVSQPNNLRAITAKQNDLNSRFLQINITDEGTPIKADPSSQVIMNVKRTDDAARMFYGSVNDDGSVTVPLTSWMLGLEGSINCDVSIVSTEDLQRLTSMQFSIYVEAAVFPQSELEESDDTDVLMELLKAAENSEAAKEAAEEANEAADKANRAADGVVTIEQNRNTPLKFWVGSQEEYDALVSPESDCFYIISDDTDLATINANIQNLANAITNMHTPYNVMNAVVPGGNLDEYSLTKLGNLIEGNYTYTLRQSYSQYASFPAGTHICTIKGYAPVNTFYVPARPIYGYIGNRRDDVVFDTFFVKVAPDDTGKNTVITLAEQIQTDDKTDGYAEGFKLFDFHFSFIFSN